MPLGLDSVLPFSKQHKGKKISDILKEDPGFLLWLRDKRKTDNGDDKFFSPGALLKLNEAIRDDNVNRTHGWRGKFTVWPITGDIEPETKEEILAALAERKRQEEAKITPEDIYKEQWGVF